MGIVITITRVTPDEKKLFRYQSTTHSLIQITRKMRQLYKPKRFDYNYETYFGHYNTSSGKSKLSFYFLDLKRNSMDK
jgi:hypothetical protein